VAAAAANQFHRAAGVTREIGRWCGGSTVGAADNDRLLTTAVPAATLTGTNGSYGSGNLRPGGNVLKWSGGWREEEGFEPKTGT